MMTAAILLGLAPATVLGQQPKPDQAKPAGQAAAQQQDQSQQIQQALDKLRQAEQQLKQAMNQPGGQGQQAVDQARQQAGQALQQIRQVAQQRQGGPDQKLMQNLDRAEQAFAQPGSEGGRAALDAIALVIADVDRIGLASAGQDRTQVAVQQPAPQVTVQQPAPQVTVQQPRPEVTIEQPRPQVSVEQPKPEVTVRTAQPEVTVRQARPEVEVERAGEPEVTVERTARPEVGLAARPDAAGQEVQSAMTGPGISAEQAVGRDVIGANGEEIGEVNDLLLGPDGKIRQAVVEYGGFLGLGEEERLIDWSRFSQGAGGDQLMLSMTKDELSSQPRFDPNALGEGMVSLRNR